MKMNKKNWGLVFFFLPLTWTLDQLSKHWALHYVFGARFYGPLGFILHKNPGAMLGAFADLPPLLRVVSLSTGGAFLIFIYGILQYLVPGKVMRLRVGMSILLGGILGNVWDRIVDGSVTDFIVFGTRTMTSPAFNIADAVQWLGYIMIVWSLSENGSIFWPNKNLRNVTWVNPKFQLKYCLILMANGAAFALISAVFTYTFLKMTITDLVPGPSFLVQKRFLMPFLQIYGIISITFISALFVLGKTLSHRTAGPIYAFEKFIEDVLAGKARPLKLRAGDEFKELEELAVRLNAHLFKLKVLDTETPAEEATEEPTEEKIA
jgi:signal peptidase II